MVVLLAQAQVPPAEAEASSARSNPLSSIFTGEPSRSGSSAFDAASVLLAVLSLSSAVPLLAIPAAVLVALGRGELGSSMYQLYPGSSTGSSRGDASATFPAHDAPPAELRSMRPVEGDLWELTVWSPSMQREVTNDVLLPRGTAPRPTFYLMMGQTALRAATAGRIPRTIKRSSLASSSMW